MDWMRVHTSGLPLSLPTSFGLLCRSSWAGRRLRADLSEAMHTVDAIRQIGPPLRTARQPRRLGGDYFSWHNTRCVFAPPYPSHLFSDRPPGGFRIEFDEPRCLANCQNKKLLYQVLAVVFLRVIPLWQVPTVGFAGDSMHSSYHLGVDVKPKCHMVCRLSTKDVGRHPNTTEHVGRHPNSVLV